MPTNLGEEPDIQALLDPVVFCEALLDFHPFDYQRKFLRDQSKRIVVCAGRQIGKSSMAAARAVWFALTHEKTTTIVISATLRQSLLMFQRILSSVQSNYFIRRCIRYLSRTTVRFSNGSEIKALPCGMTGFSVRGHTAHFVITDETAFMPQAVIAEVILPMLSTTQGTAIMISTPFDKDHIFCKAYNSASWSKYHYPSSVNPLIKEEFLEEMKELVGKKRYAQEYLAEFADDEKAYFPMALLREAVHGCTYSPCTYCEILSGKLPSKNAVLFGGYDPGGQLDPGAFVAVEKVNDEKRTIRVIMAKTYLAIDPHGKKIQDENLYTRFTVQISDLHQKFNFRKIFVDQTGLGRPIIEHCRELKLPVEGMTLTSHAREDLLANLRIAFEQGRIVLPPGEMDLLSNLSCIEVERTRQGGYSFSHPSGTHDDLAYALALAVWGTSGKSPAVVMVKR